MKKKEITNEELMKEIRELKKQVEELKFIPQLSHSHCHCLQCNRINPVMPYPIAQYQQCQQSSLSTQP